MRTTNSTILPLSSKQSLNYVKPLSLFNMFILLVSALVSLVLLSSIKKRTELDKKEALQAVMDVSLDALHYWADEHSTDIERIATDNELITIADDLLHQYNKGNKHLELNELKKARAYFAKQQKTFGTLGFFIIAPDGMNVGSMRDNNMYQKNLILTQRPALFQRVLNGETLFIPPIISDVALDTSITKQQKIYPTMFFATPIKKDSVIIGVLTQRLDPKGEFSLITHRGRIGKSGETYVFDRSASLLSESRFHQDLVTHKLLTNDDNGILTISIKDPGSSVFEKGNLPTANDNLPLTKMATSAIKGSRGYNVKGYHDYRGVSVIGVWDWSPKLGIGITTELDVDEAYSTFYKIRLAVITGLCIIVFFAISIIIINSFLHNKVTKTLSEANVKLEKEVEERTLSLEQSERHFRSLVLNIPGVVFRISLDENRTVIFISEQFTTLTEYPLENFYDKPFYDLKSIIPEADFQLVNSAINLSIEKNSSYTLEHRINAGKGTEKWVLHQGHTVLDEKGNAQYLDGFIMDISDRIKMDQELKIKNRALEQNPAMVIITNSQGTIEYVNQAFTQTTGFSIDDVLGEKPNLYRTDLHVKKFYNDLWQTISQGNTWHGEMLNKRKDSSQYWGKASIAPVFNKENQITHYIQVMEDISQTKEVEERLQQVFLELTQSEKRLELILESGGIGVWEYDIKNNEVYTLEGTEKLFGFESGTILKETGKKWRPFKDGVEIINQYRHPDDIPQHQEKLRQLLTGESINLNNEYRVKTKPGEWKWIKQVGKIAERAPEGLPLKAYGVFIDIDKTKQLELELIHAKEMAETANRAKSSFLANMSHEIRTPMVAILGFTQLLQNNNTLPEDVHEHLTIINNSGRHLLELINDILDMAKIEEGKITIIKEPFNLHQLLYNIEKLFKSNIETDKISFIAETDNAVPEVIISDERRVKQVLINLINNAKKFTDEGEIKIHTSASPGDSPHAVSICFSVSDTGVGIQTDDLNTIFNVFEQSSSGKKSEGGTGLGLAICKELAHLLGGSITVTSTPNMGSTFYFTITAQIEHSSRSHVRTMTIPDNGMTYQFPPIKVLVVDDEDYNRQVLSIMLESVGFQVRVSSNGKEGIEAYKEWEPRVVIMDIKMPEMDGFEAAKEIRSLQSMEQPILIALSANIMEIQNNQKEKHILFDTILAKPFLQDDIFSLLDSILPGEASYENPSSQVKSSTLTMAQINSEIATLDKTFRMELYTAAINLDLPEMTGLIEIVKETHPQLSDYMMKLVDQFDFESLQQMLDKSQGQSNV